MAAVAVKYQLNNHIGPGYYYIDNNDICRYYGGINTEIQLR